MNKKLWEIDHPYYCEESGYYYNTNGANGVTGWGAAMEYDGFDDFIDEWEDCDLDMNFIFRWDWLKCVTPEEIDNYSDDDEPIHRLTLFYMMQRKGCKKVITINGMKDSDEKRVIEFLEPRWEYMKSMWEGLS